MYWDMKVGERTDLAGWQIPGNFGGKYNGMNDKCLALRQRALSGVIFGLLCGRSGNHTGV